MRYLKNFKLFENNEINKEIENIKSFICYGDDSNIEIAKYLYYYPLSEHHTKPLEPGSVLSIYPKEEYKDEEIDHLFEVVNNCKKYGIENYNITKDTNFESTVEKSTKQTLAGKRERMKYYFNLYEVNVNGDVNLRSEFLDSLPINFGNVNGDFDCSENSFENLEGSPHTVSGNFDCCRNDEDKVLSLIGGPKAVGKYFYCYSSKINSLVGSPDKAEYVDCSKNDIKSLDGIGDVKYLRINDNKLESLKGVPKDLDYLYCANNQLKSLEGLVNCENLYVNNNELISLKGCPDVMSNIDCSFNKLKTLDGGPREVDYFDCRDNSLETLQGGPDIVKEDFLCSFNKLENLEGAPSSVGNSFWCDNNPLTTLRGTPIKVGKNYYCYKTNVISKKRNKYLKNVEIGGQVFSTDTPKEGLKYLRTRLRYV